MAHKKQQPRKRKGSTKKPQQKLHKIDINAKKASIDKHLRMLQAQGKMSEAINNNVLGADTIPDLIRETISGIYRLTTTLKAVEALLEEGVIKLMPELPALSKAWDRDIIRFEENADAYITLKNYHVAEIEANAELSDEEKQELIKDDNVVSDIVYDLMDSINSLFLCHATEIADITIRHGKAIDDYINDHILENEDANQYAIRVTQKHIEEIRPLYRTALASTPEKAMTELTEDLVAGETANVE